MYTNNKYFRILTGVLGIIIFCSGVPYKRGILSPTNYPIPIFESATSFTPFTYVVQANTDYTCYMGYILDDSELRFRVKILSDWEMDSTECVTGWINKTNLIVNILENGYDDAGGYIYLYDTPQSNDYEKIYTEDIQREAIILDFYQDGTHEFYNWVKIMLSIEGECRSGWINRFCSSALSGCN